MKLGEIIDLDDLSAEVSAGYVTRRVHPDFPELEIFNYTDKCAFDRHWTPTTRITRGLIANSSTGEVLARPFHKIFNFDEKEAPRILDDQVVWHWDNKFDGSLGILYVDPLGFPRIATRGSFASEQAVLGTNILHDSGMAWEYAEWIDSGYTPLFEICGPDNRIVLRYDLNFLAPLGKIEIATGHFMPPTKAEKRTMRSLLGDLSRSNAEGWVVWLSRDKAVKIKQADYVELHRMVSNLTPKEVWRQLRAGTYAEYVKQLPDELYQLAEEWANEIRDEYAEINVSAELDGWALELLDLSGRKAQAEWIKSKVPTERRGLVFSLLDGKPIRDSIYRMIEPKGNDGTPKA